MNSNIYSLTESQIPDSDSREVVLQYEREAPFQTIRFRREDWYDLLVDQIVSWSLRNPAEMRNHWRFEALKEAIRQNDPNVE